MSEYIRKKWVNGEQIVADDLNRMEAGITESLKKATAAAGQAVELHSTNQNNPHNVTAEQVGAAEKEHKHIASDIFGLQKVATTGSYNDLDDKPTIPEGVTVDTALDSNSENPVQNKVVNIALANKAPKSHASNSTSYGKGTATYYGHVKLSDEVNSEDGVDSGVAATPAAVKAAYDLANGKANNVHGHAASDITSGTFGGHVQANASAMGTLSNPQVRDIKAGTTDLTPGTSPLATGSMYFVYE